MMYWFLVLAVGTRPLLRIDHPSDLPDRLWAMGLKGSAALVPLFE